MKINTTKTLVFNDGDKEMTVLLHRDRASFSISEPSSPGEFFNVTLSDMQEFHAHLGMMINSHGIQAAGVSQAEIDFVDQARATAPAARDDQQAPPARASKKLFKNGGKRWTEELLLKAGRLLTEGLNYTEVGKIINRSPTAIYHQHKRDKITNFPFNADKNHEGGEATRAAPPTPADVQAAV